MAYLGFLSLTFTSHRTAGEGSGYFFNFSSTRFTDIQTLVGRLLQRVHLCTQLATGPEPGAFGFQAQVSNHHAMHPMFYKSKTFISKVVFHVEISLVLLCKTNDWSLYETHHGTEMDYGNLFPVAHKLFGCFTIL